MAILSKKKLVIGSGVAVMFIFAAIVVGLLFYINSYKHLVETTASEKTGLDVKIHGRMGLSFFPFGLSAKAIHITKEEEDLLSLKKLKIGIELIPLLDKKLIISYCELGKPTVVIIKDHHGKYNFENSKKKPNRNKQTTAFSLKKLKLSQGKLVYFDKKANDKTELKDINLSIYDLLLDDISEGIIQNVSFAGNVYCREMMRGNFKIENIKSPINAENGVISFKSVKMDIFGAKGEGDADILSSRGKNTYKINLNVPSFDFENFTESLGFKKAIGGKGILEIALAIDGNATKNLTSGVNGTFFPQWK